MDSWTSVVCFVAFFATVSSDCGKNGCGGGRRAGGFSRQSSYSSQSSFNSGPAVRTNSRSFQQSGPGWQASYNMNPDGSWSRQSSWSSDHGYSSSKAALSGFTHRGAATGGGAAGGMVEEVVRTGGGGRRTGGGGAGGDTHVTGGGVRTVVRTTTRRNGGGGRRRNGGGSVARGGSVTAGGSDSGSQVTSTCEDKVFRARISDNERVTSCSEMIERYPSLCSMMGSIGGDCCMSCRSRGKPNCLDQLSGTNVIQFESGVRIESCEEMVEKHGGLCATFGGPGNLCCNSCSRLEVGESVSEEKGDVGELAETDEEEEEVTGGVLPAGGSDAQVDLSNKGPVDAGRGGATQARGPTEESRGDMDVILREKAAGTRQQEQARRRQQQLQAKGPDTEPRRRGDSVRGREDQLQAKGPTDEVRRREDEMQNKGQTAPARQRPGQMEKGPSPAGGRQGSVNACVDRSLHNLQSKGPGITCADFVARDPCHCQEVAEQCCASCSKVDLNTADCMCRDTLSATYPYYVFVSGGRQDNGQPRRVTMNSCSELMQRFPNFCAQIGGPGQACCRSCRVADIRPAQTCTDTLSQEFPIMLSNNESITDCRILRRDYTQFCEDYGGQGGACCRSCRGVDLSCVDDPLRWWQVNDGERMKCREYIHSDPCHCQSVGEHCCKSCKNVDLSQCGCRDTLSAATSYVVRSVNSKGGVVRQRVTSCQQVLRDFPEACGRLGGAGSACCQSCSQLDECIDRLPTEIASALGVDDCSSLVRQYPEMCVDVAGACCASCKNIQGNAGAQVVKVKPSCTRCSNQGQINPVGQTNDINAPDMDKQAVGGQEDLVQFKGPVLEMTGGTLEASIQDFANQIHGSVNVDDIRKVTFVNENGPVHVEEHEEPEPMVEWEEEYENVPIAVVAGGDVNNEVPQEVSGTEDYILGPDDSENTGTHSRLDYYDYGGSKGDRETTVIEEEDEGNRVAPQGPIGGGDACVDREMGKMQSKGPGLTCRDLISRDPCFCEEVKNECCASCAGIVLTPERCSCRDLLSSVYPYYVFPDGRQREDTKITFTSCYDLVSRYPNFCDELGQPGQSCCSTCRRANIQPDCMDKLSPQYPLYLNGRPVDDCRLLARDYKDQCKSYGGQGQACCQSCRNVGDLSCVDDSLMYWEVDGQRLNCRDYVYLDPCRCLHVNNDCCDSCRRVDTRRCHCRDMLSARNPYFVQHYRPDGSEDYRETVTSCSIIVRDYPQFCRQLGGQRNTCCRACMTLSHLQSKGPSG